MRLKSVKLNSLVRIKICDADLTDDTTINLHHIVKNDIDHHKGNQVIYELQVEILNCTKRNVAGEILDMFLVMADKHLDFIQKKFESKLSKFADKVSSVFRPNGGNNALLTPLGDLLETF